MPERLVHACLHVTEQVWQPMHLSRFITIAIWAITRMGSTPGRVMRSRGVADGTRPRSGALPSATPRRSHAQTWQARSLDRTRTNPSVGHLLRTPANDGDLVSLVAGGAQVVERVGQLGV